MSDLALVEVGGQDLLYATSSDGTRLTAFSLANGLTLIDQAVPPAGNSLGVSASLETATVDGATYLVTVGPDHTGVVSHSLNAGGIGNQTVFGSGLSGPVSAFESVRIEGSDYFVMSHTDGTGLSVYRATGAGGLQTVDNIALPSAGLGPDIVSVRSVESSGSTYILALSAAGNALSSFSMSVDGTLTPADTLDSDNGLYMATPTALETVTIGNQTYTVLAAAGTDSLSVVRINSDGGLTLTDHVMDSLATRFNDVVDIGITQIGDFVYVVAGGSDDGVSLLQLLPDGTLLHVTTFADTGETALTNPNAIVSRANGQSLEVMVVAQGEAGLTQLSADIGVLGASIVGTNANETHSGTSANDVIWGADGNDILRGNAGDDTLVGGAGNDQLTGGNGRDTFVFRFGETNDTITDFNPNEDRIDLSAWGRVYTLDALDFTSTSNGGIVEFRGERLVIQTHDGQSLNRSDFTTDDLFVLEHTLPQVVEVSQEITGTSSNDLLVGTEMDDSISAGQGRDTLRGDDGADHLDGGNGMDLADYESASNAIVVDLAKPDQNTGEAAGDTYVSIEDIRGTSFDDILRGDELANDLFGGNGNDWLVGRGGDDRLLGQGGDDTLIGGAGADRLEGNTGFDQADYRNATAAVTADLEYAHVNTGEAAGDTYHMIEGLSGSAWGDSLRGNAENNRLSGQAGDDFLVGRDGADSLFGADGDDLLNGGSGADLLDGGDGTDRVEYRFATSGLRVNLSNSNVNTGEAAGDIFRSVEGLRGSLYDDFLTGSETDNWIFGDGGNDRLVGLDGDDELVGGDGHDELLGGRGADTLDGGAGDDTAVYSSATSAVSASLKQPTSNTGDAAGDTYSSIENLLGSRYSDTLSGSDTANVLRGANGADELIGHSGDDELLGMQGADVLIGGQGADTLNGGAGVDRVDYRDAETALTVDLNSNDASAGAAEGDVFLWVENVFGGAGNDELFGNGWDNHFRGGGGKDNLLGRAGNDTLEGMSGNDKLNGGSGDDLLTGGIGADRFVFSEGQDTVTDFVSGEDDLRLTESLWGTSGRTAQQIVDTYASSQNGNTVFNFGNDHILTLLGVSDPSTLIDDISFV